MRMLAKPVIKVIRDVAYLNTSHPQTLACWACQSQTATPAFSFTAPTARTFRPLQQDRPPLNGSAPTPIHQQPPSNQLVRRRRGDCRRGHSSTSGCVSIA